MNTTDPLGDAFDRAAHSYDRLVGANPGYHAHLRLSAARMRLPRAGSGLHLLDLGCGTGASTAALLRAAPYARITGVDSSPGMLERARRKPWPDTVRFVQTGVPGLSAAGITGPFDGVLAAYLVRNLTNPDERLTALRDLLRPGGTLAVHEYSVRGNPTARVVWETVCRSVIIPAGRLLSGDATLYHHLRRSVHAFDSVDGFTARLRRAGFVGVHAETMTGWQRGIVHTFLADAPRDSGVPC